MAVVGCSCSNFRKLDTVMPLNCTGRPRSGTQPPDMEPQLQWQWEESYMLPHRSLANRSRQKLESKELTSTEFGWAFAVELPFA